MPTLQELKDKWFISDTTEFIEADPGADPPVEKMTFADLGLNFRHAGSGLVNHTDGNDVTILGEGDSYMSLWHDIITGSQITFVYNTSWRIDDVLTKQGDPLSVALDTLIRVNNNFFSGSADVFQFVDGNKMAIGSNIASNRKLVDQGVTSTRDFRFPVNGSNHHKFMVAKTVASGWATMGSIDITVNRLDDNTHSGNFVKITHDFGVLVEGPAVADIERTFVERWNDTSRTRNWPFEAIDPDQPEITEPIGTYVATGSHSIQVLRTYGVGRYTYDWADDDGDGEFSIWASTLNAIKKAEKYIYIEDQTFLTFAWPPCCDQNPNPLAKKTDLVYQLGEALKRGVKVGIVLSKKGSNLYESYQRHYSLRYLSLIAIDEGTDFFVGSIDNGSEPIYIHSKMFVADDEFALIGSANFDQRSMCHDGEIKIGVVDENDLFVKNLRSTLYQEHSERAAIDDDPLIAFDTMKSDVESNTGRLRNYDFPVFMLLRGHENFVNRIGWPYAGPKKLR